MSQTGNVDIEQGLRAASEQEHAAQRDSAASQGDSWIAAISFPVLALTAIVCAWRLYEWYGVFEHRNNTHFAFQKLPGGFDHPILRQTLTVFLLLSAVYIAVLWLLRKASRLTPLAVISLSIVVVGMAVGSVLLYPVSALDVFNYMVELKLTYHYDQNPYLETFEAYRERDPFALPAFLVTVTLFYGPAWLLTSWIPVAITGFGDVIVTLIGLKVFNVVLLGVIAGLIAWQQAGRTQGMFAAAIVVANPLVWFEGVANAHNDVLLTVFLIGAMVALQRRSPLAGPLLALSALVKVYTVVLVPLFIVVALRERWELKRIGSTVALTLVAVVMTCAPYWADGKLIDGLRGGLEESQGMDHVSPYSLAQQQAQHDYAEGRFDEDFLLGRPAQEVLPMETQDALWNRFAAILVISTLALAASAWKGRDANIVAAETLLVLLLTMTNLYAWYLIPVFALLALRADRWAMWFVGAATVLGLVYNPMFVYAHFNTGWSRFEVHQFLALFLTAPILVYLGGRLVSGGVSGIRALRNRRATGAAVTV